MVRALEKPVADPTYLKFFGLTRPPFGRLAKPSQLYPTEQYSLLAGHLACATKESDSVVFICGADGSGKSTLLDRFIACLGDGATFATFDNTCNDEEQFYCEFLAQIGFSGITGTSSELKNITREFLVHRGIANDPVLIIIDNAHLTTPVMLEQLQFISDIKVKGRRVLSVVLAGNADLVRVIDAPIMDKTRFRSHVLFNIRNYTEEETTSYIWHRLRLAGGIDGVKISNEAHPLIQRFSGGIPHLINELCDDMLAESFALKSRVITENLVRTVADKKRLLPHVIPLHGRGRRRTDPDFRLAQVGPEAAKSVAAGSSKTEQSVEKPVTKAPYVDPESLLERVSQLSEQVADLRADKMRALQDISARDKDVSQLRDKLESQTAEMEVLTRAIADNTGQFEQQHQALSDSIIALRESKNTSMRLAARLEKEAHTREAAQKELAAATATAEALSQQKLDLQAAVEALKADLKVAGERAAEFDTLEKITAQLKQEIELRAGELDSLRDELGSRDQNLTDLEKLLEQSQIDCESAKHHIEALQNPEAVRKSGKSSKKLTAKLEKETRTREAAQKDLAAATATMAALSQEKLGLQAAMEALKADLTVAGERAAEFDDLERITAELRQEIELKAGELDSLRDELSSRGENLAALEKLLEQSQQDCEMAKHRIEDLKNPEALRKSETTAKRLAADLEKETRAREAAQMDLDMATATAEDMRKLNMELQAALDDLKADFKVSSGQVAEIDALKKSTADLKHEIERNAGELLVVRDELDSRDQAFDHLKSLYEKSQKECELQRIQISGLQNAQESASKDALARSAHDPIADSSKSAAQFLRLMRSERAYQTLQDTYPTIYDGLINTHRKLIEQGFTEKQTSDSMRTEQAKLIEKLIPRASDEAVITYARLMVDQLQEFLNNGCEPCFKLLIPQTDGNEGATPVYSESTKERELAELDIVLRSYDADRHLPKEQDVWPDLEPILVRLFEEFGEENVSALQNSHAPNINKFEVCNISKALYSGILALPERNAAKALRWILSP